MRLILLSLLIVFISITGNSHAREIQKWTDENGQVHYGDYTENYKSTTLNVTTVSPSGYVEPPSRVNRKNTTDKLLRSMQDKRQKDKSAREKATQQLALKIKNCDLAKSQLATNKNGGRLVKYDANGERSFVGDDERAENIANAETQIAKWCK